MSNGIYPDYVGPTQEYRRVSLFPDWVGVIGQIIQLPVQGIVSVEVLPIYTGVAMVESGFGALARQVSYGVRQLKSALGVTPVAGPDVEIVEEIGHE